MAFSNVDRFSLYNLAVQFCQEVLEQSGPQYYLNLFQSLLNNVQFAPSFKYFTNEDAHNFFLCYPQVFTINDGFVCLSIQPLMDIQQSMNIYNDLSRFIYKIRKEQTKAFDIGIGQKNVKVRVNSIYEDIHEKFSSSVSDITELSQSIKRNLVYSIFFLLRTFQPLNLERAFKTVLYIVKNASSNFLDLSKTNKQMFVKAMCKVLKAKLPVKYRPFKSFTKFKKSVLLFATYLLIERRKISFNIFSKTWGKLNIHPYIPKYEILKVLKTSEFIVIDKTNSMSLSPSFEPVNFIVESYSKLILQVSLGENWNSNQNEQDLLNLNTVSADCDIQSTCPSYKAENASNCTKALCEVPMLNSQSNHEEKTLSIKKEKDFSHPMRVSKADNIVETSPFKGTENKHEASEKSQMAAKKFSFNDNEEKLLECSFFIIRRYFKDALPNHIVLSFLLASKNVCENFAILSIEDQFDFLENCFCSINAYEGSPSESNYHKIKKSTLVEEGVLIICYLVVKSGGIHYTNLIKLLKERGICVQVWKNSTFAQARMYFLNICNYINFSKKRFLNLKPPFSGIKRSLKNKYVSAFSPNYIPSYACADNNSLCFQISNEYKNISPELVPSSSSDFHDQIKDSLKLEVGQTAEEKVYSDQNVFDAKDIIDTSVFILSICEKMHIEQLCSRLSCANLKNIKTYSSLNEPEKLTFFKGFPQYFTVDSNGYVSLEKGVANFYEPQSEIDFSNFLINCSSTSEK